MDFMEEKMRVIADQTVRYNGVSFTIGNELDIPEDLAKVWIEQKKAHKKNETTAGKNGNDNIGKSQGKKKVKNDNNSGKETASIIPGMKPEENRVEE